MTKNSFYFILFFHFAFKNFEFISILLAAQWSFRIHYFFLRTDKQMIIVSRIFLVEGTNQDVKLRWKKKYKIIKKKWARE